jgi:hypothetical protein
MKYRHNLGMIGQRSLTDQETIEETRSDNEQWFKWNNIDCPERNALSLTPSEGIEMITRIIRKIDKSGFVALTAWTKFGEWLPKSGLVDHQAIKSSSIHKNQNADSILPC